MTDWVTDWLSEWRSSSLAASARLKKPATTESKQTNFFGYIRKIVLCVAAAAAASVAVAAAAAYAYAASVAAAAAASAACCLLSSLCLCALALPCALRCTVPTGNVIRHCLIRPYPYVACFIRAPALGSRLRFCLHRPCRQLAACCSCCRSCRCRCCCCCRCSLTWLPKRFLYI